MRMRFIFLLLFSKLFGAQPGAQILFSFEILQSEPGYRDVLQRKADELTQKGFACRITPLEERLTLRCNDIKDPEALVPTIEKFKKHHIAYKLIHMDETPKQTTIGKQIPLYIGYRAYDRHDYTRALGIFRANYEAERTPAHAEAYALVLAKLGEQKRALAVLKPYSTSAKLVEIYQSRLIAYIDQLVQKGNLTEAKNLIAKTKLSRGKKTLLQEKITFAQALAYNRKKDYNASLTLLLSEKSRNEKAEELLVGNLLALSTKEFTSGKYEEALRILEPYRRKFGEVERFSQRILYDHYLKNGWESLEKDPKKALHYFRKSCEVKKSTLCKEGKMYSYDKMKERDKAIALAEALYSREAKDKYLKLLIANYLHKNEPQKATECYTLLKEKQGVENPQEVLTAEQVYRYIKAGNIEKARALIVAIVDKEMKQRLYQDIAQLQKSQSLEQLAGYSRSKMYVKCYEYATKLNHSYTDASINRIGGWCAFNGGEYAIAKQFFEKLFSTGERSDLYGLALSSHKSHHNQRAEEVMQSIAVTDEYRLKIASLYRDMGQPRKAKEILVASNISMEHEEEIRAINRASTYEEPVTQTAGGLSYHRNKGSKGKEYLEVTALPVDIDYLFDEGEYHLYGEFDLLHLHTGAVDKGAGTFGFGQTSSPYNIINAEGVEGHFGIKSRQFQAAFGFTPSGMLLSPRLTAKLAAIYGQGAWNWHSTLEQLGIKQTFLSYVGQSTYRDGKQYSWGRVLKRGATVGVSYKGETTYSLDLSYYPDIEGKNTVHNSQFRAVAAATHHTATKSYAFLDLGATVVYDAFERNSNLFTYGHGGYFSPQHFWHGSLTVDMGDYIGERFYYRFKGAVGYQKFRVDAAERFPLTADTSLADGYDESGLTLNTALQAGYAIDEHFDLTAGVRWEKIYGYDLLQAGLSISYHFKAQQNALLQRLRESHKIDRLIP